MYDGRTRIGLVLHLDGSRRAFAFDDQDNPLGEFPSRKVALAAVSARYAFETGRRA